MLAWVFDRQLTRELKEPETRQNKLIALGTAVL